jgi:hypothetical protein
MSVEDIIDSIIDEGIPDMEETPYKVLFDPTKDQAAEIFTRGEAIDIKYKCPKCETSRASTWLFPDSDMHYTDECCGEPILFKARETNDS